MDTNEILRYFDATPSAKVKALLDQMAEYLASEYRADLLYMFEETNITEDLLEQHVENEDSPQDVVDLYMQEIFYDASRRYAATL